MRGVSDSYFPSSGNPNASNYTTENYYKICQNYLRSSMKLAIEIKCTSIVNGIFHLYVIFVVIL